MRPQFAVGIGCRKGCPAQSIAFLVRRALALAASSDMARNAAQFSGEPMMFTSEAKGEEAGIVEAAQALGLKLVLLPRGRLEAAASRCETRSARVQAIIGLPSLAEAAALAGAGEGSRLVQARISEGGASCAIALPSTNPAACAS
ncbi:MAG: cobalamin biosynthesis protein [Hyphomicrobiales bacterium]|nr:cobalamin biosynthesis protein [Hyphomicrobiales bacterium]